MTHARALTPRACLRVGRRRPFPALVWLALAAIAPVAWLPRPASATPANKAALVKYFGSFLPKPLNACTTCHLPGDNRSPQSLEEFPHNPFGRRLYALGKELKAAGKPYDLPTRLAMVAGEDADGDGVDNLTELLTGHAPGEAADKPSPDELARAPALKAEFAAYLQSYRWQPFEPVRRPDVPTVGGPADGWVRTPVDAFVAAQYQKRGLTPRPEATKAVLLRRVYLDLIGLAPTPAELEAFERDQAPDAYGRVVDRLLADPRYGERWGRHWMDVWRYSDWAGWAAGNQVRDSQRHLWRWRDWIVESLNADKGYDRMLVEMLAADETAPDDADALRATGFLARNYKMLSREQWLDDTVNHTARAFLGVTMGCAKCHDHRTDPIAQAEYYQMRAIFEPHQVRLDRVPGQADLTLDGLARVYDAQPAPPTYLYVRGDEKRPDTSRVIPPGVPAALGGSLAVEPIKVTPGAAHPDKRPFVLRDVAAAARQALLDARTASDAAQADPAATPARRAELQSAVFVAEVQCAAQRAVLRAEGLEDQGKKGTPQWQQAAEEANALQRKAVAQIAAHQLVLAQNAQATARAKVADLAAKKTDANKAPAPEKPADPKAPPTAQPAAAQQAEKELAAKELAADAKVAAARDALAAAQKEAGAPPSTAYQPRPTVAYPDTSTGRRLAFARWLTAEKNPLAARVAVNHLWLRHFGQGIVPSPDDFGLGGRPPSDPQLLDWLAAEFMSRGWRMKPIHRLIVTSSVYRLASTPDARSAPMDPEDRFLWRMPSRRLEAEAVRDNVLYTAGQLDLTRGGPELDPKLGLTSRRRSLYFRLAAEKEVEFLKLFDGPSIAECYQRRPSVVPQQALAMANSELTITQSRLLARDLTKSVGPDADAFIRQAFVTVLSRRATDAEVETCRQFLRARSVTPTTAPTTRPASDPSQRARENLILVLFNHNDFVTVR